MNQESTISEPSWVSADATEVPFPVTGECPGDVVGSVTRLLGALGSAGSC